MLKNLQKVKSYTIIKYFTYNNLELVKKIQFLNSWNTQNFKIYINNMNTYILLTFM
jgi:hypothetical protein